MVSLTSLLNLLILVYPPFSYSRTLEVGNLTQSFISTHHTNVTVTVNAHCTTDESWLLPRYDKVRWYRPACRNALDKARSDPVFDLPNDPNNLGEADINTDHEFLDHDATAQTTNPQIRLPRKYTACKQSSFSSRIRLMM